MGGHSGYQPYTILFANGKAWKAVQGLTLAHTAPQRVCLALRLVPVFVSGWIGDATQPTCEALQQATNIRQLHSPTIDKFEKSFVGSALKLYTPPSLSERARPGCTE